MSGPAKRRGRFVHAANGEGLGAALESVLGIAPGTAPLPSAEPPAEDIVYLSFDPDGVAYLCEIGRTAWGCGDTFPVAGRRIAIIRSASNDYERGRSREDATLLIREGAASVRIIPLPMINGDTVRSTLAMLPSDALDVAYAAATDWKASDPEAASVPIEPEPRIEITHREHEVNDQAIAALARDRSVYVVGFKLATILEEGEAPLGTEYPDGPPPQVATLELATIREKLAANAEWVVASQTKTGMVIRPAHPPDWTTRAVYCRGRYPGIRRIEGVIEAPTIRADGTILSAPGYDPATRLYYRPRIVFPPVPESPTRDDATAALDRLLDLVDEFPFKDHVHGVAWLAHLLTVAGRASFDGPAPLCALDGNTPGSGKSMLTDIISIIASGRRMTRSPWPTGKHGDEELRKRITAMALRGTAYVLLDNVVGTLGGPALDAALTSTTWEDRVLGASSMSPILPMRIVWFASGNNLVYRGDMHRRILPCRLESPLENPEERSGFKYPDLLDHVASRRAEYLRDALVILRAHHVAGRPRVVPLLGSFEAWTKAVVDPVAWVTGLSPLSVRDDVKAEDAGAQLRIALVEGWSELPRSGEGLTAAEALEVLKEPANAQSFTTLRIALSELSDKGDLPSARSIGRHLKGLQGRSVNGRVLRGKPTRTGIVKWRIEESA